MIENINMGLAFVCYPINFLLNTILFIVKIIVTLILILYELTKYMFGISSIFKFVPKKNHYRNKLNLQVLK